MTPRRKVHTGEGTSRDRLVAASKEIIYRQGIRATSVDDLASAANVSKPTLYAHFANKDDLVENALEQRRLERQTQIAAGLESIGSPMKRLVAILELHASYVPEPGFRGCPLVAAALELPDSEPARRSAERFKSWLEERMAREADAAGLEDPRGLAASLLLLIEGAIVMGYVRGGEGPGQSLRRAYRKLLECHAGAAGE